MKGKSLIGVILAAICVTVTYLLPGSEELSHEGITALGVLGMASILWISNTLPFGVTGLLSAMAEYPAEDVELLAWLLVYGESYGDLDAFRQDIRQRLAQDDQVLAAVEQAIDRYNGN